MALKNYGVLKGLASDLALDDDESPHIEIRIEAGGDSYRIAVNVRSRISPHDLLYTRQDPFNLPALTTALESLPEGINDIGLNAGSSDPLALDYVRGDFVERDAMEIAPFQLTGPLNDLRDYIEPIVRQAISDQSIHVYAFGESWGPEPDKKDKYFEFLPGRGIHDIHMNQGSSGNFQSSNGIYQDGALLFHFTNEDRWSAIFLAFQSQSWQTDSNGNPTSDPIDPRNPPSDPVNASVAIVAAMINAPGSDERGMETVTLLNRTDASVDITGWRLLDVKGRSQVLNGAINAGETKRIVLVATDEGVILGNQSGVIRLESADGSFVDNITYTKKNAARDGWTTVF